jgi:hypothetical protein
MIGKDMGWRRKSYADVKRPLDCQGFDLGIGAKDHLNEYAIFPSEINSDEIPY